MRSLLRHRISISIWVRVDNCFVITPRIDSRRNKFGALLLFHEALWSCRGLLALNDASKKVNSDGFVDCRRAPCGMFIVALKRRTRGLMISTIIRQILCQKWNRRTVKRTREPDTRRESNVGALLRLALGLSDAASRTLNLHNVQLALLNISCGPAFPHPFTLFSLLLLKGEGSRLARCRLSLWNIHAVRLLSQSKS